MTNVANDFMTMWRSCGDVCALAVHGFVGDFSTTRFIHARARLFTVFTKTTHKACTHIVCNFQSVKSYFYTVYTVLITTITILKELKITITISEHSGHTRMYRGEGMTVGGLV